MLSTFAVTRSRLGSPPWARKIASPVPSSSALVIAMLITKAAVRLRGPVPALALRCRYPATRPPTI